MADLSRIAELERRVEQDPASIAFAQLAEEYRRVGRFDDAVRVCRTGLARHPVYPSARVTLGRALVALGQHEDAMPEFARVIREAPENIAARRALEELERLRGPVVLSGQDEVALRELESWLQAIVADRASRVQSAGSSDSLAPSTSFGDAAS